MRYAEENFKTYKVEPDGERYMLANFTARIITEIRYVDDRSSETFLTITGQIPSSQNPEESKPINLPPVTVDADKFPGMNWVMQAWGTRCVLQPGGGTKEELRTAIQLASTPETTTIYKHLGWTRINKELTYLHSKGGISKRGNDPKIQVALPAEMNRFDLSKPAPLAEAAAATIDLLGITAKNVTWPLLAATLAPVFGPVDFALHLTGRTGTFKSELMSLFQSHYGSDLDARHLPGSWSSTANALEAQAHIAKNAAFVVDDFVPSGTSWQVKSYQQTADKLIRAQGNQAGRARLNDTSSLQSTMYPRGCILSTGEDTPEGHSVRARMLILELSPGDIKPEDLTKAQANRKLYPGTTAALIQDLAKAPIDIRPRAQALRDQNIEVGHSRTPAMLGHLEATAEAIIQWLAMRKIITSQQEAKMIAEAFSAIMDAGGQQQAYIEAADPCELFTAAIRNILGAKMAHLRTTPGNIPFTPDLLGWTTDNPESEHPSFRSHGPTIGWVDWDSDELFLDVTSGYAMVKKIAGPDLSLGKQTMFKRLKDAGAITRADDNRNRNTIRITAEHHTRQVIALRLSETLKLEDEKKK